MAALGGLIVWLQVAGQSTWGADRKGRNQSFAVVELRIPSGCKAAGAAISSRPINWNYRPLPPAGERLLRSNAARPFA